MKHCHSQTVFFWCWGWNTVCDVKHIRQIIESSSAATSRNSVGGKSVHTPAHTELWIHTHMRPLKRIISSICQWCQSRWSSHLCRSLMSLSGAENPKNDPNSQSRSSDITPVCRTVTVATISLTRQFLFFPFDLLNSQVAKLLLVNMVCCHNNSNCW